MRGLLYRNKIVKFTKATVKRGLLSILNLTLAQLLRKRNPERVKRYWWIKKDATV